MPNKAAVCLNIFFFSPKLFVQLFPHHHKCAHFQCFYHLPLCKVFAFILSFYVKTYY